MGHWGIGALGHWGIGALEHWGIGALEHWGIGVLEHWGIGALGHWGIGALEHWGIHSWRFHSLLDMAFLFCFGASIWLSMPVFSWFVEQLMHNGMVKMVLLAEFD